MDCGKSFSDRRALALATALLAITLNFLQPLVHAALMRDGAPATLWSVFCNTTPDTRSDSGQDVPLAPDKHECCLGLTHAAPLTPPSMAFSAIERTATTVRPLAAFDQYAPAGIRDGPHRPRGPPSFV